jgi:hypothetical protein
MAIDYEKSPRLKMVEWYEGGQLIRTGLEVLISTYFSKHSDSRHLDGISTDKPLIDYRDPRYLAKDGSFWFDYASDTGDGWNSTYAIAYAISQPSLKPEKHDALPRGKLLVLGGDLVYPYPTRQLYEDRFIGPFSLAGRQSEPGELELLSLPGNHDWYDSLVNFRRIFCRANRVAGRNTQQTRSYFSAHLPGNWRLLGVDIQLERDLDEVQYKFFCEDVLPTIGEGDRVILCIPEPTWQARWENVPPQLNSLLTALREQIGDRLRIAIAGDFHHYQRHSSGKGTHLVTCGTAGAFLHPTHQMPQDPTGEYVHQCSFPPKNKSWQLTFWNLAFFFRNPWFGLAPGLLYLLAAWQNGLAVGECFSHVCIEEMGTLGLSKWQNALMAGVQSALLSPIGIALYGLIFAGFVFFSDRRSKYFRRIVGTLHASTHIAAGFLIYWFGAYAAITLAGLDPKSIPQYLMTGTIIFLLGAAIGSIILGIYLLISLNVFGMHRNEAFSSLRIQDWKGFLRFQITPDGTLHAYYLGFKKIPRSWKAAGGLVEPADPSKFVCKVEDRFDIP